MGNCWAIVMLLIKFVYYQVALDNEKSLQDYFNFTHLLKNQADPPFLVAVKHWAPPPALKESLTKSCPKGLGLETMYSYFVCIYYKEAVITGTWQGGRKNR